jgi:putative chitinase
MFPGYANASGKVVGKLRDDDTHKAIVAAGFPTLLTAMAAAKIDTPARQAAFLTTLCFESLCEYSILQGGSNTPAGIERGFTGRGYIQLTGPANYTAASAYLGVDLVSHPELAQSIDWSAKIATWYWTVARPGCNAYADAYRMGKVNAAIGYPLSGSNDADRCMVFGKVLAYLTGSTPAIDCNR